MQQHINFKRERRLGDKLNATFAFFSQNIKPLLTNTVLVVGPFALVAGVCFSLYQTYIMGALGEQEAPTGASHYFMLGLSVILMMITTLIASTLMVAVVQRMLREYVEKGSAQVPASQLWSSIWGEFFSVLGSSFGIVVLMCILMAVIITPLALLATALKAPALVLLIVLLVFFAVLLGGAALMLIYPIRSFERKNFFEALNRAMELNAGKWLSTAGLFFIVYCVQSVMMFAAAIPNYILMFMRMMHARDMESLEVDTGGVGVYDLIGALSGSLYVLGFTFASSLLFIGITFQYFSLRENKEASGLLERMQAFGVAEAVHEEQEQY
ncbi:hypothetical protein [Cesiribacter andamanensis]|uniref:Uncharacterized protein n=1 Tax=Cesiribacter andamanensis AMV16 TaxID=1279009 RepID=M7NVJ3_9BACT|nr:hypothetical protein [Cesiribacter andamanensis]EMR02499.1 hypothetical protein ADICEAN_02372 [Cesiribacter andamanensis AMV16]